MARGRSPEDLGPCPICGRPLLPGESVDRHHWRPRSWGGTEAAYLHRTCHRKLHSLFQEKELATEFADPGRIRQHPEMQRFIRWVRRQPPDRIPRHRPPREGRPGGRRRKAR